MLEMFEILFEIIFFRGRWKARGEWRRSKSRLKNARLGDLVVYEYPGTGILEKREIVRLTNVVAIVKQSGTGGSEELYKLDANIEDLYGVSESDLKIESVKFADKDIICKTLIVTKEGITNKYYIAPDVVPVGGLVKIEIGGEVLMRLVDYHYGKDIEKDKQMEKDMIGVIYSEKQFDRLLAKHLTNYVDLHSAILYVGLVNVSQDDGYKLPLPPEFYRAVTNAEITLKEFEDITSSDDRRTAIKESVILDTRKLLSSADVIKEAVETARIISEWDKQSRNLVGQAVTLVELTRRIEKEDLLYMSKSEDFTEESEDQVRAFFDGRLDSLGFSLGYISFTADPLLLVKINPVSFASKFGLQDGDKILLVDSVIVNNFYEVKKIIYKNKGNTIKIELLRNNKKEVIDVDVPSGFWRRGGQGGRFLGK